MMRKNACGFQCQIAPVGAGRRRAERARKIGARGKYG
jgi:hypothetical protein